MDVLITVFLVAMVLAAISIVGYLRSIDHRLDVQNQQLRDLESGLRGCTGPGTERPSESSPPGPIAS